MKLKTHSGMKKRAKVRKGGTIALRKASKRHLLSNKSKRQKKAFLKGMPVTTTRNEDIRRLLPYA